MVIGHGIDLVEIGDLRRWIEDPRDLLLSRCFTPAELADAGEGPNRIERLAGRFAAKEAVLKALGTGFGGGIAFTDVEVRRQEGGAPEVILHGGAAVAADRLGITRWMLSTSHTDSFAMASAIAVRDAPADQDGRAPGASA